MLFFTKFLFLWWAKIYLVLHKKSVWMNCINMNYSVKRQLPYFLFQMERTKLITLLFRCNLNITKPSWIWSFTMTGAPSFTSTNPRKDYTGFRRFMKIYLGSVHPTLPTVFTILNFPIVKQSRNLAQMLTLWNYFEKRVILHMQLCLITSTSIRLFIWFSYRPNF